MIIFIIYIYNHFIVNAHTTLSQGQLYNVFYFLQLAYYYYYICIYYYFIHFFICVESIVYLKVWYYRHVLFHSNSSH